MSTSQHFSPHPHNAHSADGQSHYRPKRSHRRAIFLKWLRKTHLYLGLWGAILGLLFGASGILLNHRSIMKIPVDRVVQKSAQLPLPEPAFTSATEMAQWLQRELQFTPTAPPMIKSQPPKKVIWADRPMQQPERWSVSLQSPDRGVNAEYLVGNRFVQLDQIDATPIGTLTRLHMGSGVNAFWILLSDSIAGSLILLSLSGLLLWTELHKMRTITVFSSIGALLAAGWFIWSI
jgi:hypothetical protein